MGYSCQTLTTQLLIPHSTEIEHLYVNNVWVISFMYPCFLDTISLVFFLFPFVLYSLSVEPIYLKKFVITSLHTFIKTSGISSFVKNYLIKKKKHNVLWHSSLLTWPVKCQVFPSLVCGSLHKLGSWHSGSDTRCPEFIVLTKF